jgi:hypothetical protein
VTMRSFVIAFALLAACEPPPPVKTASGERLESVSVEESFPVNPDVKETRLTGDRLRAAVALMDKHGVTGMTGTLSAKGVVDSGSVSVVVRPVGGSERRVTARSCVEPKLCAFLDEALAQHLIERRPVACKSAATCAATTR